MAELEQIVRDAGIDQWGVCAFADALPLLEVRAKARIPENAKSIIVFLFGYYTNSYELRNISRYAIVDDYHTVIRGILENLAQNINKKYINNIFIPFVDASPLVEVRAAYLSGLGDVGRNGQLLNPVYGSYCFIGEIVTDLVLPPGQPQSKKMCVNCGQCLAACPTGALSEDGFDKTKCRSFLTQKKGALSEWERGQIQAGGFVWGCDRCTDACPVNRQAAKSRVEAFYRDNQPVLGYDTIGKLCETKAYGWRGEKVLRRNLDIISGKDVV